MLIPIILAGGKGKRLYPISTEKEPKQFKRIFSEHSLLQNTILRLNDGMFKKPIILSNSRYLQILLKQLEEIKCLGYQLILEKELLGTALSIAIALLTLPKKSNIIILPSDHYIDNICQFESTIKNITKHLKDKIILLSTEVRYKSNDYGYLITNTRYSCLMKVIKFREKPTNITFETNYSYFWNTGIVLSTVEVVLQEFYKINPELMKIASNHLQHKQQLDPYICNLPHLIKDSMKSIDEVIMQNSDNIYTTCIHSTWYDFGNLVSIFDYIKNEYRNLISYPAIDKIWGNYKILYQDKNYCIKHLYILPNSSLSLQYHEHRDEFLQVLEGKISLILDGRKKYLKENEIYVIEKFVHHQIINQSQNPAEILEIQYGEIIDENDVVRLRDGYTS